MASPNLNEIVTTTLRNRSGKLADNVTNNNALLARMKKKGSIKPVSGGRTIVQELEYAQNGTYQRYAGYQVLNIQPSDVFTAAEFDWKQAAVAVTWNGLEIDVQNTGEEQVIDLLEGRIKNAEKTWRTTCRSTSIRTARRTAASRSAACSSLIADAPTSGTVGGIDRAAWPFWRNQVFSGVTNGGAAVSATNIQSYMNQLWLATPSAVRRHDLIIADNNYFNFYWQSLQAIQRITQLGQRRGRLPDAEVHGRRRGCRRRHRRGLPGQPHVLPEHRLHQVSAVLEAEHDPARDGLLHQPRRLRAADRLGRAT
jgi:hypothetical protein